MTKLGYACVFCMVTASMATAQSETHCSGSLCSAELAAEAQTRTTGPLVPVGSPSTKGSLLPDQDRLPERTAQSENPVISGKSNALRAALLAVILGAADVAEGGGRFAHR
ncbi:MAG: hypothetical protein AAGF74_02300 [Pseudomonadota bacterium]